MAVMGDDDDADATKCTGDPDADAGRGAFTVTLANETAAMEKTTHAILVASFINTSSLLQGEV
jgi:hypothetical protein